MATVDIFHLLNFCLSNNCEVLSYSCLICIVLITDEFEHVFKCLLAFLIFCCNVFIHVFFIVSYQAFSLLVYHNKITQSGWFKPENFLQILVAPILRSSSWQVWFLYRLLPSLSCRQSLFILPSPGLSSVYVVS